MLNFNPYQSGVLSPDAAELMGLIPPRPKPQYQTPMRSPIPGMSMQAGGLSRAASELMGLTPPRPQPRYQTPAPNIQTGGLSRDAAELMGLVPPPPQPQYQTRMRTPAPTIGLSQDAAELMGLVPPAPQPQYQTPISGPVPTMQAGSSAPMSVGQPVVPKVMAQPATPRAAAPSINLRDHMYSKPAGPELPPPNPTVDPSDYMYAKPAGPELPSSISLGKYAGPALAVGLPLLQAHIGRDAARRASNERAENRYLTELANAAATRMNPYLSTPQGMRALPAAPVSSATQFDLAQRGLTAGIKLGESFFKLKEKYDNERKALDEINRNIDGEIEESNLQTLRRILKV